MDYLKALHEKPDLAEEFDSLFDFFLLDELSPRDEADGRATFTLPGMAFALSLIHIFERPFRRKKKALSCKSSNRSCLPISLPPRRNRDRRDNHGKA